MSDGGGYIASPTHAVTPDIRFDQIMAMFDVFLNRPVPLSHQDS
jgi:hypothetical protein